MDVWGLVAGSGWAAGLNLYAVAFLLGMAGRLGWSDIPEVLTRTDVMVTAAVLYLIEFAADKVPYLDNLWDVIHTVVRPLGAAALGFVLAGESESIGQGLGAAVAGALALSAHSTKATTRAAVNVSPEPVSNISLSLFEDGLAGAVTAVGVWLPLLALLAVALFVVAGGFLVLRIWRAAAALRRRWRGRVEEARRRFTGRRGAGPG